MLGVIEGTHPANVQQKLVELLVELGCICYTASVPAQIELVRKRKKAASTASRKKRKKSGNTTESVSLGDMEVPLEENAGTFRYVSPKLCICFFPPIMPLHS